MNSAARIQNDPAARQQTTRVTAVGHAAREFRIWRLDSDDA
jgi:hypothetical protein